MVENFGELLTAMVTPFDDNMELDLEKAGEIASYLVDNGSDGLVVLGTTGEVPTLNRQEKIDLLTAVVEAVGDKASIVAGTGNYCTAESIEMTEKAEEIGVDGVMLVVPYYNKPPQEALYNHFRLVAESTSLPVMIYNVPGRTSRNILPATMKKLSKINNIIAIKEASGDIGQVAELTEILPEDFCVYSGDDNLTLPLLSVGGQGVVSVAAHLVGNDIKNMIRAYKEGNVTEAAQLNKKLGPIFRGIFLTTNPIPVKTALNMIGKNVGDLRSPLLEMDEELKGKLQTILQEYKLI